MRQEEHSCSLTQGCRISWLSAQVYAWLVRDAQPWNDAQTAYNGSSPSGAKLEVLAWLLRVCKDVPDARAWRTGRECVALVRELPGEVEHIVLPTFAVEHKQFVGPFSRAFPKAAVHVAPRCASLAARAANMPSSLQPFP